MRSVRWPGARDLCVPGLETVHVIWDPDDGDKIAGFWYGGGGNSFPRYLDTYLPNYRILWFLIGISSCLRFVPYARGTGEIS